MKGFMVEMEKLKCGQFNSKIVQILYKKKKKLNVKNASSRASTTVITTKPTTRNQLCLWISKKIAIDKYDVENNNR